MRNKATLLIAGPIFSAVCVIVLVSSGVMHPELLAAAMATAVLLWSPLPVSLAAVICNEERAKAGAGLSFVEKPFKLYPRMWAESRTTVEAHLTGFALLLALFVVTLFV